MSDPLTDPLPDPLRDPITTVLEWSREGRGAALATVVRTWGSSPRRPGSHLAVDRSGGFVGSVSGGCVEGAVIDAAAGVIETGEPVLLDFGVTDEDAWAVGLACGGEVSVWVERVAPDASEGALGRLERARRSRDPVVLAIWLDDGSHAVIAPSVSASEPAALAPADSADPPAVPGGATPAPELHVEAARALAADRSTRIELDGRPVFLDVHNPPLRLVVVGAVHITQPLVEMAALADFEVTVVDPRDAFATPERFPGVELVRTWPDRAFEQMTLNARTAVVTLTHDPKLDDPALSAALASPVFYIGALGSRRTHARRLERLREAGVDEAALERIRGPVGLDIGAVSPSEIALSILAEIVATLRAPDA